MLRYDVLGLRPAKQRHELCPVDDAVTGRSPAVILLCAFGRHVLHLDGDDAVGECLELCCGVATGPDDPAAIDFQPDILFCALEDQIDGARAIGKRAEFEIMIVPRDP